MKMKDPFELLGLPRSYVIDRSALQKAYLQRAASLHPDRFTDPIEQVDAAAKAAQLNRARDMLTDDEQRASVLLELMGGPSKAQDQSLPDGFLMDMMEVRQQAEDAIASGDPQQRQEFEQWATSERQQYIAKIEVLFEQAASEDNPDTLRAIRLQLNAWRYIERLLEQLDPADEVKL